MDGLVGALVKGFIIGAAVDPCTPQKHTGMVAALAHHLPAVLQGLRLPGFVADVLPAGHFGEHQQAQLVAGIQEGRALGVVAGAHGIAAQVLFDELGIRPFRYRPPATNWTVRKPNRTVFPSSTRSGRPLVPGRMSFTVRVYRVGCSMLHGCTPFRVPVMGRASSPR